MAGLDPKRCVFVNCPFDDQFKPLLQAMLFCIVDLGFVPRLATERMDSAESRLAKIVELIEESDFSIHDLSRISSAEAGEHYRLNMSFELGIDYASRRFLAHNGRNKKILVLVEQPYRHMPAISDLNGCDVQAHRGQADRIIREVRNWLVSEAYAARVAPTLIVGRYTAFQAHDVETHQDRGYELEDIEARPLKEVLAAMESWITANPRP